MSAGDFLKSAEKAAGQAMKSAGDAVASAEKSAQKAVGNATAAAGKAISSAEDKAAKEAAALKDAAAKEAAAAEKAASAAVKSAEDKAQKEAAALKSAATKEAETIAKAADAAVKSAEDKAAKEAAALKSAANAAITSAMKEAAKAQDAAKNALSAAKAGAQNAAVAAAAVAKTLAKYAETGAKAVAVLAQVPTFALAQVAALIYAKANAAFGPDPIDSAVASCPSKAAQLAEQIQDSQNLLAKVPQNLDNNPDVKALRDVTDASVKALMADDVYSPTPTVPIPGQGRLSDDQIQNLLGINPKELNSTSPNFHAAIYAAVDSAGNLVKPPHYTLAFRGTDKSTASSLASDLKTDVTNALGLETKPYANAMNLAKKLNMATLNQPGATMDLVGHSMGGGMVQAASAVTGAKGTTFNAAGWDPASAPNVAGMDPGPLLTNYHVAGEVLTTAQQSIMGIPAAAGKQVAIPGPLSQGMVGLHGMNSVESGMQSAAKGPQAAVTKLLGGK